MADTTPGTQETSSRIAYLDNLMNRIEANTSDEGEIITFIEGADTLAEKAANTLFDGLMYTLYGIGEVSVQKAKTGSRDVIEEYEKVARAIDPLANALKAIAGDQIPFRRNEAAEARLGEVGDNVSVYNAYRVIINGERYRSVQVFIRPERYEQPLEFRQRAGRPQITLKEQAQPRMQITAIPENAMIGEVTMRIDQEDLEHNMQISYDIVVGDDRNNLMDQLNFAQDAAGNPTEVNQRYGHHFNSTFTAKKLGTDFKSIMEAYNDKIEASIVARENSTPVNPNNGTR